ncbi:MAG: hypothetical protein IRY85_11165 [Micromonosporaceae bacterium]|nr:hypothetical protein [Micromonosporaceae bacterium]
MTNIQQPEMRRSRQTPLVQDSKGPPAGGGSRPSKERRRMPTGQNSPYGRSDQRRKTGSDEPSGRPAEGD